MRVTLSWGLSTGLCSPWRLNPMAISSPCGLLGSPAVVSCLLRARIMSSHQFNSSIGLQDSVAVLCCAHTLQAGPPICAVQIVCNQHATLH